MTLALQRALDAVGATKTLRERAEYIVRKYDALLDRESDYVFISDTADESGQRSYGSLWYFVSDLNIVAEAHNFIISDELDVARVPSIYHILWKTSDWQEGEPSDSARAVLDFQFAPSAGGVLRAKATNVDHLYGILREFILPRVISDKDSV